MKDNTIRKRNKQPEAVAQNCVPGNDLAQDKPASNHRSNNVMISRLSMMFTLGLIAVLLVYATYSPATSKEDSLQGLSSTVAQQRQRRGVLPTPRVRSRTTDKCFRWVSTLNPTFDAQCQATCESGSCSVGCTCSRTIQQEMDVCDSWKGTQSGFNDWCDANCPSEECVTGGQCYCSDYSEPCQDSSNEVVCPSGKYFSKALSDISDTFCQATCGVTGGRLCPGLLCDCNNPLVNLGQVLDTLPVNLHHSLSVASSSSNKFKDSCNSGNPSSMKYKVNFKVPSVLLLQDCCLSGDTYHIKVDGKIVAMIGSGSSLTEATAMLKSKLSARVQIPAGAHEVEVILKASFFGCTGVFVNFLPNVCDALQGFKVLGTAKTYLEASTACRSQGLSLANLNLLNTIDAAASLQSCIPSLDMNVKAWIGNINSPDSSAVSASCMLAESFETAGTVVKVSQKCDIELPVLCQTNVAANLAANIAATVPSSVLQINQLVSPIAKDTLTLANTVVTTGGQVISTAGLVGGALGGLNSLSSQTGQLLQDTAGQTISNVNNLVGSALGQVGSTVNTVADSVGNSGSIAENVVGSTLGQVGSTLNKAGAIVNNAGNLVGGLTQNAGGLVGGVVNSASGQVGSVVSNAGDTVASAGKSIGGLVGSVGNVAGGAVSNAGKVLGSSDGTTVSKGVNGLLKNVLK